MPWLVNAMSGCLALYKSSHARSRQWKRAHHIRIPHRCLRAQFPAPSSAEPAYLSAVKDERTILHYTIHYDTIQYNAKQHNTTQYCAVQWYMYVCISNLRMNVLHITQPAIQHATRPRCRRDLTQPYPYHTRNTLKQQHKPSICWAPVT